MSVKPLPPSTIKLISSSQVVTSVASAVKELVENSIDAGATSVDISLVNFGLDRIEVKDNGTGVSEDDVNFMCQRGFTSKISDFGDLDKLVSYGFRGEALYSICALGNVTITTIKSGSSGLGKRYCLDSSGRVVSSSISHIVQGTVVEVEGLFSGARVRREAMTLSRRRTEELKRIEATVKRLAVARPSLRISLRHNGHTLWLKYPVPTLRQGLLQAVPPTLVSQLVDLSSNTSEIRMDLLVPKRECNIPTVCYSNPTDASYLFVNFRPVTNSHIDSAIKDEIQSYFGHYMPSGKHPLYLASLHLPPDWLDVNLEPNKSRVIVRDMDHVTKKLKILLMQYYIGENGLAKMKDEERAKKDDSKKVQTTLEESMSHSSSVDEPMQLESQRSNVEDRMEIGTQPRSEESMELGSESRGWESMQLGTDSIELEDLEERVLEEIGKLERDSQSQQLAVSSEGNSLHPTEETQAKNRVVTHGESSEMSFSPPNSESSLENPVETVDVATEPPKESVNQDITEKLSFMEMSRKSEKEKSKERQKIIEDFIGGLGRPEPTLSQWSRGEVLPSQEGPNKMELDRSVSSQMGCKNMSAFTKFARDTRSAIIEQEPGVSFTKVAGELVNRWKGLKDEEKKEYEERAEKEDEARKKRKIEEEKTGNNKLRDIDPKKRRQENGEESGGSRKRLKKKDFPSEMEVDISVDSLTAMTPDIVKEDSCRVRVVGWCGELAVCILPEVGLALVSAARLGEALMFHNNLETLNLPSKPLISPICLTQSELGEREWAEVTCLKTVVEPGGDIIVSDPRVTMNGIDLVIKEDCILVRSRRGECDVKEVLGLIANGANTVSEARTLLATTAVRSETIRMLAETKLPDDPSTVNDCIGYWVKNVYPKFPNCPHNRPVMRVIHTFPPVAS